MIFFGASSLLHAQSVTNVKDKRVLLNLGAESWEPGDKVFALDDQGKKKALMRIKKVKNGKALADIIKGSASTGMAVIMGKKGSGGGSTGGTTSSSHAGLRTGSAYGYTAAVMMNTMSISKFNSTAYGTQSVDMVGTNFGAGMFYDYPLSSAWFARGHGTIEMFDVEKKVSLPFCAGTTKCSTTFLQSGFYGTFNYVLTPSPMRWWVGGGGGAVIYLSKESSVLKTSSFFFNTIVMGAVGVDIFTSRNSFFPIAFEYQMIPDKEAGVTSLVLRGGWGTTF
jgi:hypothetical protein